MHYLLWHGVAESARAWPDRAAVHDGSISITYAQLDADSLRFGALLAGWGIGRGDHVALWLPKSIRSVTAMVGTARAGAAYVPVDPAAPVLRAAVIVGNSRARILLTSRRLLSSLLESLPQLPDLQAIILVDGDGALPDCPVRCVDWSAVEQSELTLPKTGAVETDPAYILYTSGSTGVPKGVVISHRNALTFIEWSVGLCDIKCDDRLSSHAPLHFDLSVFDIYGALFSGACVYLIPDRVAPFPVELARWIDHHRITIWYSVPSALIRLRNQGQLDRFRFDSVRLMLFAGEVFPVKHLVNVMDSFPLAVFYNWYGPTETNVCTYHAVPRPLPPDLTDLPIGRSCENYDAFAVLPDGRLATVGEEGELIVRGPGVMVGYWGLPERTAQSLVQNPLHTNFCDPTYRTGDIVRLQDDGSFVFIGRRDHMVKTRGYRVELGEIEHVLHLHEAVGSAAVIAVPDQDVGARLWAAVVAEADRSLSSADLAGHCRDRLPQYAVPERFTIVRDLPLTSTGKVDRESLRVTLTQTLNTESQ